MQELIFTLLVTCVSRGFIFWHWVMGQPGRIVEVEAAGMSATRCLIPSGGNLLDALLMVPVDGALKANVLICHGIGETVDHWRGVQRLLAEHGICSLVFDYSGYGRSTGRVDAGQCERDAVEAFCFLQRVRPAGSVALLGYSLGSAVATSVVSRVPARRLILCAAFPSLREAAQRSGLPGFVARWLPDIWDNEEALRKAEVPVLIVHGAADRLFPASIAERLAESSAGRCELVVVPGVTHDAPIYVPTIAFWGKVARRL